MGKIIKNGVEYVGSPAFVYETLHRNVRTVIPTSWTTYAFVTVPVSGVYRIEALSHPALQELVENRYVRTRITVNGSVPTGMYSYNETLLAGKTDYYANTDIVDMGVLNLNAGQTVALQLYLSGSANTKVVCEFADLFILKLA